MQELRISYLGQTIVFDDMQSTSLRIRGEYRKKAIEAEAKYRKKYDSYGKLDVLFTQGMEDGFILIAEYIDGLVKELIKQGVYDVDRNTIIERYGEEIFDEWLAINKILDDFYAIGEDGINELKQARELRKATRSRLVGGGFGIAGAAKGIALAGSFNAVSGLLHSGANAIGNSITRANFRKKQQELYMLTEFRELVFMAIHDSVESLGAILKAYNGIYQVIPRSEFEAKAKPLRNNFSMIPEEDRPAKAIELLKLTPDSIETHQLLLEFYGDPTGGLFELAKLSGIEHEFQEERKKIFGAKVQSLLSKAKYSLDQKVSSLKDVEAGVHIKIQEETECALAQLAANYAIKETDSDLIKYKRRICNLRTERENVVREEDKKRRTVNGVVYETLRLAGKAENLRYEGKQIVAACGTKNLPEMEKAIAKLEELNRTEPVGALDDVLTELQNQYQKAEQEARTFQGVVLSSIEECQKATNDYRALIEKSFGEKEIITRLELKRATELQTSDNFHPVAREKFLIVINEKEKRLIEYEEKKLEEYNKQKQKEAAKEAAAVQQKKVKRWSLAMAPLSVLAIAVLPMFKIDGGIGSLIDIFWICIEFVGEFDGTPWLPCVGIAAVAVVCAVIILSYIGRASWAEVYLILVIFLFVVLIIAGLSAMIGCRWLFYAMIVIELIFFSKA